MPLKTQHDEMPALNLTPMIDVVFLLIIFFMVATKFNEAEQKIALQVPKVAAAQENTQAASARVVRVFRDGVIHLDKQKVTLEALKEQLKTIAEASANASVSIRGDEGCSFQQVAEVLGACRAAGINKLNIAVRPKETRRR